MYMFVLRCVSGPCFDFIFLLASIKVTSNFEVAVNVDQSLDFSRNTPFFVRELTSNRIMASMQSFLKAWPSAF